MRSICDYRTTDYRVGFWGDQSRSYDDHSERVAMRRLLPPGERALELGAGYGRLTDLFSGYRERVLVDYELSHLEYARDRYGPDGYLYVAADIYHLPFAPGVFDTATMVRVLHHMEDPLEALRQARRALRPGGCLVLEYRNKRNLKAIGRWLSRRLPARTRPGSAIPDPFSREPVEYRRLYYGFHPDYITDSLRSLGLSVTGSLAVSCLRMSWLSRKQLLPVLAPIDSLLQRTGERWQFSPSGFVRAEAVGPAEHYESGVFWCCPSCGAACTDLGSHGLKCSGCGHLWPLRQGIYDFRMAVAEENLVDAEPMFRT